VASNEARAFAAMADPTRRAILSVLGDQGEVSAGDIAREFPEMSRAAVSSHLRVLRSADMVQEKRRGQFRYYSLGTNRADEVIQFLMGVYSKDLDDFVGDR
jgi:ArsR family transcriptional regulator